MYSNSPSKNVTTMSDFDCRSREFLPHKHNVTVHALRTSRYISDGRGNIRSILKREEENEKSNDIVFVIEKRIWGTVLVFDPF